MPEVAEEIKDEVVDQEVESKEEFSLSEDALAEVKKSVLDSNVGKAEDELETEIATAAAVRLEELKKEEAPIFDKLKELSEDEANKDKTEEELMEMAQKAVAEKMETEETTLGDDFFGNAGLPKTDATEGGDTASKVAENVSPDVKAELEEYRKLKEDKGFKAYLDASKSGNVSFLKAFVKTGNAYDVSALTPDELKIKELQQLQKDNPTITNDDLKELYDDFASITNNAEKVQLTLPIRARLEALQNEAFDAFSTKVSQDANAASEEFVQVVKEAESALKDGYLGKTFYGVELSEAHTMKVLNSIRSKGVAYKGKDGKVNLHKAIQSELFMEHKHDIIKSAYERGRKDESHRNAIKRGKPVLLKRRSAPSQKKVVSRQQKLHEAQKEKGMR